MGCLPGLFVAVVLVIYFWLDPPKGGQHYLAEAFIIGAITVPFWLFYFLAFIFRVPIGGNHRRYRWAKAEADPPRKKGSTK